MPPRIWIPARTEVSSESASQPHDPLQRGHSRGRWGVNAGRHGSTARVVNVEVVQQLVGVVAEQQQGNQQQNLDGQSGVRQLEGVAYDWFDTVTHGRSVGSPLLAWGEFSRLFMAHFLPESVRDGLAHEF
ncbi:hypothetical protein SESBI_24301 [Sesbania bispinosa]|nr:hypothetical protein SESBI_24301 [Sesbania bispinosa]